MKVLSREQVLNLHSQLIAATGGSDGVRDYVLLDSALQAPFQGFAGVDVYPTVQQKAARLAYGLIKNHAFIDGNKRVGAHVLVIFLLLNKINLEYTQQELIDIVLAVAASECELDDLVRWILSHQL